MRKIRLFEKRDRHILTKLVKDMIGDENSEKVSKEVVDDFYKNKNYRVFVYEVSSTLKGFGVLKFEAFEGANGVCEIVWLGIDKKYKRQGIGRELVHYMEEQALNNNIRKIYLKTSVKNKNAVCFWVKCDYQFESRMLDFSLENYDDYYLGKIIKGHR